MTAAIDAGRALGALLLLSLGLAAGVAAPALGDVPQPLISQPANGSSTRSQTPSFSGTSNDESDPLTVRVYGGEAAEGVPVQTLGTLVGPIGGVWELDDETVLDPGTYTAVAEQVNVESEAGLSAPATFTIDTAAPTVSLVSPGAQIAVSTPTLHGTAGTAPGDLTAITVAIHEGASTAGSIVDEGDVEAAGALWSEKLAQLPDGTYTAQATQADLAGNVGASEPVMFTIDTVAPQISLVSPGTLIANSTPTLHGTAGAAPGDLTAITVAIHKGSSTAGPLVAEAGAEAQGETWTEKLAQLPDGTYTAQASQADQAGNTGASEAVIFEIDTTPPVPMILSPSYGTVLSASRPAFSGLAGVAPGDATTVALDIYADGPGRVETLVESVGPLAVKQGGWTSSEAGKQLPDGIYTAFVHQSDQAGNAGISEPLLFVVEARPAVKPETPVPPAGPSQSPGPSVAASAAPSTPVLQWLQPFPVVRIAGAETIAGARIKLLSVQAPIGARVTVTCRGSGCPVHSEGVLAGAGSRPSSSGTQVIAFRRFQRALRAGVTLEIRVSRSGQIGKFVRFVIRRGKLPTRQDSCLDPTTARPMACPRS
jgi:Bacterial Ig-like domain